jgi:hypothetical protein
MLFLPATAQPVLASFSILISILVSRSMWQPNAIAKTHDTLPVMFPDIKDVNDGHQIGC